MSQIKWEYKLPKGYTFNFGKAAEEEMFDVSGEDETPAPAAPKTFTHTDEMAKDIKSGYKAGKWNTHAAFLKSDSPHVSTMKQMHEGDIEGLREHFNNITGRWKTKPSGINNKDTGMNMGNVTDEHWKVPDLSEDAKKEIDSYPTGKDFHAALANGNVSKEVTDFMKDFQYHHKKYSNAQIGENTPISKFYKNAGAGKEFGDPYGDKEHGIQKWHKNPMSSPLKRFGEDRVNEKTEGNDEGWKVDKDLGNGRFSMVTADGSKRKIVDKSELPGAREDEEFETKDDNYEKQKAILANHASETDKWDPDAPESGEHKSYMSANKDYPGQSFEYNGTKWNTIQEGKDFVVARNEYGDTKKITKNDIEKMPKQEADPNIHGKAFKDKLTQLEEGDFRKLGYSPEETNKLMEHAAYGEKQFEGAKSPDHDRLQQEYEEVVNPKLDKLREHVGEGDINSPEFRDKLHSFLSQKPEGYAEELSKLRQAHEDEGTQAALDRLNTFKRENSGKLHEKVKDAGFTGEERLKLLGSIPELNKHREVTQSQEDKDSYEQLVNKKKHGLLKQLGYFPEVTPEDIKKHGFKNAEDSHTPEQIYNNMGFPKDHPHKEYIQKKIAHVLRKHERETGKVGREVTNQTNKVRFLFKALTQTPGYIALMKGMKLMLQKVFHPGMTPFEKALESKDARGTLNLLEDQYQGMDALLKSFVSDVMDPDYFGPVSDQSDEGNLAELTDRYIKSKNKFEMLKAMGEYEALEKAFEEDWDAFYALPPEAQKYYFKEDK